MLERKSKQHSVRDAVALIKDGDKVAIGGSLIRRAPMALVREIVRQKKKDLTLYSWSGGMDYDLLIGAGCVKEAWSSYCGLFQFGMAMNFRRGVESGQVRFVDLSETCAKDKFRAAAFGNTYCISKVPLHTSIMENPEFQNIVTCPFTGEEYVAMEAYHPDVAILHAHRADKYGNVQFDPIRMMDNECDILIAKSAKKVIVSVEEIVNESVVVQNPTWTMLPKIFIDAVVEIPFGAHPNSCDALYDFDLEHGRMYRDYSKTPEKFLEYLNEFVYSCLEHESYIDKCGGTAALKKLCRPAKEKNDG